VCTSEFVSIIEEWGIILLMQTRHRCGNVSLFEWGAAETFVGEGALFLAL